jgi:hypothetical protein
MLLVGMRNFIRHVIAIPSVGDGHQAIYDYKTNADNILVKGDSTMYEFFVAAAKNMGVDRGFVAAEKWQQAVKADGVIANA